MYELLVIDDETEVRKAICDYFPWDEIGFDIVAQFGNGKDALDYILKNKIDVLLCDIKMPIMTGIELAAELWARNLKIKTVFLSGFKEFEYAQKALEYKVSSYIVKPAKYKDLHRVFNQIKTELDKEKRMLSDAAAGGIKNDAEDSSFNDKIITTIKNYIESDYKNANVGKASELVHISPNYLSQFFRQKTGQYFSDYLNLVRMKKAAELLKNINYKTYEVSEKVGYTNPKNFSRAFKTYYGKSPKEFKNC